MDALVSPDLPGLPANSAARSFIKRRRSSVSRRRTAEDRTAVLGCFRTLMTRESEWFASLSARAPSRFDVAGIAVDNMRLCGELLFLAHGLKPAVLFSDMSGDDALDYVRSVLLPSELLQNAPVLLSYSQPEPPRDSILASPRLLHLHDAFYALRIGAVTSPQSDLTDRVIVFHRPLAAVAAPGTLSTLLLAPEAQAGRPKATVTELHMAELLDYPVALPEEPVREEVGGPGTDDPAALPATSPQLQDDSPARAPARKRVRLMLPPYAGAPTLEIAYTVRHFNGAPFVVLTSYGAPQAALPAVRRHFVRYQMELQDVVHVQLVMIPL
jgi:hypothetical protein